MLKEFEFDMKMPCSIHFQDMVSVKMSALKEELEYLQFIEQRLLNLENKK